MSSILQFLKRNLSSFASFCKGFSLVSPSLASSNVRYLSSVSFSIPYVPAAIFRSSATRSRCKFSCWTDMKRAASRFRFFSFQTSPRQSMHLYEESFSNPVLSKTSLEAFSWRICERSSKRTLWASYSVMSVPFGTVTSDLLKDRNTPNLAFSTAFLFSAAYYS